MLRLKNKIERHAKKIKKEKEKRKGALPVRMKKKRETCIRTPLFPPQNC